MTRTNQRPAGRKLPRGPPKKNRRRSINEDNEDFVDFSLRRWSRTSGSRPKKKPNTTKGTKKKTKHQVADTQRQIPHKNKCPQQWPSFFLFRFEGVALLSEGARACWCAALLCATVRSGTGKKNKQKKTKENQVANSQRARERSRQRQIEKANSRTRKNRKKLQKKKIKQMMTLSFCFVCQCPASEPR